MKPLRIGFDAKRLFNNRTGLGVYSRNLVSSLMQRHPDNDYFLFTPKIKLPQEFTGKVEVIVPETPLKGLWRSWGINGDIAKRKLDIYHGLSNEIPFKRHPGTRYVCTVHDLIWLRLPETYGLGERSIYTWKLKHACKHSDLLIATSRQTADDLQELMGVPKEKIRVVYQSVSPLLPANIENPSPNRPYLLYLSSFEERKNHLALLEAFRKVKDQIPQQLVLAGRPGPTLATLMDYRDRNSLQNDVVILTDLSETQKYAWLKYADAFVYPSLYEGFGIPLIEAMEAGTPLLLNQLPVFREIAGNAAAYFDASKEGDLENKLLTLSSRPSGKTPNASGRLGLFSPDATTGALWEVYQELL